MFDLKVTARVMLLCFFLAPLAYGQDASGDLTDMSLEDLMKVKVEKVYGASRHLQKVTEAAASVTVITAEDIRHFGYRTLADVLRGVPGFYVTYDRNYSYAAVRGFGRTGDYNSRILLLIDGHRMNDNLFDLAYIGTELPLDVALIERVEVIHGPGSAMYGNNAFFAVINVITKRARPKDRVTVETGAGSYLTGSARATYEHHVDPWEALLSTTVYDSRGPQKLYFPEFDTPQTSNGVVRNGDFDKYKQAFAKVSYRDFTLEGLYGPRDKGVPTAPYGSMFGPRSVTRDVTGLADIGFDHRFANGIDVSAHTSYHKYTYAAIYPYDLSGPSGPITLNRDWVNSAWWGEEIKVSKQLFRKHLLTVGHEFRDNIRQDQGNYDLDPITVYTDTHGSSNVWAFYAQDEYSIFNKLTLNVGVRRDQDYYSGGATSPRVGLIYSPRAQTTLKLLYGQAFRAPNAYELFYNGGRHLWNTSLRPETIHTTELVVDQYFAERWRLSGSLFQNKISRLIAQVPLPDGTLQFQNQGGATARGAEFLVERKWKSGLAAELNYTFESTDDSHTVAELDGAPVHIVNLKLLAPVVRRTITVAAEFHYLSAIDKLAGHPVAPFSLVNTTVVTRPFLGGFELSGSIYNLFDRNYSYPGSPDHVQASIPQDGRTARIQLTYTFTPSAELQH